MKVLITGSNGFLGGHLVKYLSNKKMDIMGINRGENKLTITEPFYFKSINLANKTDVLNTVFAFEPNIIIHNAAMSKPDICELYKPECLLQNVTVTEYIVEAAKAIDAYLIYVSTDFIYGDNGPHAETKIPNPLNFYGESKLMAEQLIQKSGVQFGIIRPVFIYGPQLQNSRPCFLQWVKNSLEQNKSIKVVADQIRTPTYVYDICYAIYTMINGRIKADFNIGGSDSLSPYEMAIAVANYFNFNKDLIQSVTEETFKEPVQRAKKGGVFIDKAMEKLKYQPTTFKAALEKCFLID